MKQARFISVALLAVLVSAVPTLGQSATLRLVASDTTIDSGRQVTVEAFISNLPAELHGYGVGLDITGGTSGRAAGRSSSWNWCVETISPSTATINS